MERSTTSTSNSPNKTLARILQLDPSLPDILREKYSERYSMLLQDMTNDAGEFLHNLNVVKHSDNEVKAVIQAFPTALSHASVNGKFPIHKALRSEVSVPFIPVLAAESIKFNIGGGEDKRGGLLSEDPQDPDSLNLLQYLTALGRKDDPDIYDDACLDAIKKLRGCNLLRKEDIRKHRLLYWSCHPTSSARFEYLLHWDPKALISKTHASPLTMAKYESIEHFVMILKAGMKYYPEHLGFLFQKNKRKGDKTACDTAFEQFGKVLALEAIQKCIPPDANHPILHHVIKHVPQYMHDFEILYPSAMFLRDEKHRLFLHVALSSGARFKTDSEFLTRTRDYEIEERDPVTGLYPFMIAPSAEKFDVSTIYCLLRRNPALLIEEGLSEDDNDEKIDRRARCCSNLHFF